jgi:chromosome segregation ATPase
VDFSELTSNQLLIAASAISFVVGSMLMYMLFRPGGNAAVSEDPRNHRIRELEADLRSSQRECTETQEVLEEKTAEFNTAVETLRDVRSTLADNEAELENLKDDLKGAVLKTRELRQVLQDRATETVREQARAADAETELEVAKAGSDAVMGEITRLQEERKQLTNTMKTMGDHFLPDEDLISSDFDD